MKRRKITCALLQAFGSDLKFDTLKHRSSTRWESRHKSVSALIAQYPIILKTFAHLKLSSKSADVRRSAEHLTECMTKMGFLVSLLMWEKILRAVYAVSKQLPSKSANLSAPVALLGETVTFISTLRNDLDNICQLAEDMAKKWGVETSFNGTRIRTRKRFFDELLNDACLESPRDRFRIHVFLPVVDTCLGQLKIWFESLLYIVDLFSFLFP